MNLQRLDNRRLTTPGEEETTPLVSVTKSYARLNPAATALLGMVPGQDFLGFGYDNDSKSYVFYKATDEKGGKKLSPDATINSESIFKRLNEGSTYSFGEPIVEANVAYFPLVEEEQAPAEDEKVVSNRATVAGGAHTPLTDAEYDKKYAPKAEAETANDDFL